jgi:O-antigen/teichoic acid export membrane protein
MGAMDGDETTGGAPAAGTALAPEPPPPASDPGSAMTGVSLIQGGAWNLLSLLIPQLFSLIISVVAARYLGPELFGRQSFVAFVALSVFWVLTGGLSLGLMRSLAETLGRREPAVARGLLAWAWRVEVVIGLIGGGGLAAIALVDSELAWAWLFAGAGTFLAALFVVPSALLLGAQRFRDAALVGIIGGAVAVPATVAVLAAGGGVAGMFAVEAATVAFTLALGSWLSQRTLNRLSGTRRRSPELERSTTRFALTTTATIVVSLIVWRRSEFFFLAHYSPARELAMYSIAFAAVTVLAAAPEKLGFVITAAFATLTGSGEEARMRQGFGRSLRLLTLLVLPLVAAAAALGPAFVKLVYGPAFDDVGPVLLILLLGMPFVPMWNVAGATLSGLGHAREQLLSGVAAAVVNVALAFLLIPRFDAIGAAIANVGGQLSATLVLMPLAYRAVGTSAWRPASLGLAAGAAAVAGLLAWGVVELLGGAAGVVAGSLAFTVAFTSLAVGLHIVSADDAAWLDDQLGHRLGGRLGRGLRLVARPASPG